MLKYKVDIYTNPHKLLRKEMFELSNLCVEINANNIDERNVLLKKAKALFRHLADHSRAEDTYAHPIINQKLHREHDELAKEHHEQEEALLHLESNIEALALEIASASGNEALVLGFYRKINRFISNYLAHLDEEERLLEVLWRIFEPEDLFAIMVAFKSCEDRPGFEPIMHLVNLHLSSEKKASMFTTIYKHLGTQIFSIAMKAAQKMLTEKECWEIDQKIAEMA